MSDLLTFLTNNWLCPWAGPQPKILFHFFGPSSLVHFKFDTIPFKLIVYYFFLEYYKLCLVSIVKYNQYIKFHNTKLIIFLTID